VLDTNVLVSGLLWGGAPNQLLRWARDGVMEVVCCEGILAEVERVVGYAKPARRISALESSPNEMIAYLMNQVFLYVL
jgi:putative PIN family toxin of toxin-antitoxin system